MKKNTPSIILMIVSILIVLVTLIEFILVAAEIADETHFIYFTLLASSTATPALLFLLGAVTYKPKEEIKK